ncbi:MAG: acyltransferase [Azonexus sp.]
MFFNLNIVFLTNFIKKSIFIDERVVIKPFDIISKDGSAALMVLNLICTIMIVAIHNNSMSYIDIRDGYDINFMIQQFIVNGISRSAVPIFALLSGFFVFIKIVKIGYFLLIKQKIVTLAFPYILTSAILYFSVALLKSALFGDFELFNWKEVLYGVFAHPVAIQYWFLRDLIIIVAISPLVVFCNGFIFAFLGVVLGVFWLLNIQPFPIVAGWYVINIEVLFFFWVGVFVGKFLGGYVYLQRGFLLIILSVSVWIILIIIRIYLDPNLDVWYVDHYTTLSVLIYKLHIFVGVFCLFAISYALRGSYFLIGLSGLTFFVYAFHTVPVSYISHLVKMFVPFHLVFYVNFPLIVIIVFSAAYAVSVYFPRFYSIMTGGRNQNKVRVRIS